jgi:hypothetical protein
VTARIADSARRFRDVVFRFRLNMHGDRVRPCFDETRNVMIRSLDHQVHLERKLRQFAHGGDDRRSEGNIIDEMAIHNVEVKPVRARLFHASNVMAESREIRSKHGRRDYDRSS